jgi:hypothetical protein
MELSIPLEVSATRGLAFPDHGSDETPLVTIAPRRDRSMNCANSRPEAKVPEAVMTGFFRFREPRLTLKSMFMLTADHPPRPRAHLLGDRLAAAKVKEHTPKALFRRPWAA